MSNKSQIIGCKRKNVRQANFYHKKIRESTKKLEGKVK